MARGSNLYLALLFIPAFTIVISIFIWENRLMEDIIFSSKRSKTEELKTPEEIRQVEENGFQRDNLDILSYFNYSASDLNKTNGVSQTDFSLLQYVQNKLLIPPAAKEEKYNLKSPETVETSMGQAEKIRDILKNKTGGFFVECGALDGETRSNSLYLERFLQWEGLLVEASPKNVMLMAEKNRKAWLAPTCLSLKPFPTMVHFLERFNIGKISAANITNASKVVVQCIPFTTLLLAIGRKHVDYFSLDVEGHELDVLKTIDFDQIDITTLSVEFTHINEKDGNGKEELRQFMESKGYRVDSEVTHPRKLANDFIFVKN